MEPIERNIELVRERIAGACRHSGRDPGEVTLMAVTKTHPVEAVEAAWAAGIRVFGENRVQEAGPKIREFSARHPDSGASFHMIGHLQSNKARDAVASFSCVESVDSAQTLAILDRRAGAAGRRVEVLFEYFTADEETKSGFRSDDGFWAAVDALDACPNVVFRGLMTIAPFVSDETRLRQSFGRLRAMREEVRRRFPGLDAGILSMGMSNDYELAVEEGATLVRIGTAIFGERVYP